MKKPTEKTRRWHRIRAKNERKRKQRNRSSNKKLVRREIPHILVPLYGCLDLFRNEYHVRETINLVVDKARNRETDLPIELNFAKVDVLEKNFLFCLSARLQEEGLNDIVGIQYRGASSKVKRKIKSIRFSRWTKIEDSKASQELSGRGSAVSLEEAQYRALHKPFKTATTIAPRHREIFYKALLEIAENSVDHAKTDSWYGYARAGGGLGPNRLLFLDHGIGIPNSLRLKFHEKILSTLSGIAKGRSISEAADEMCLRFALSGQRTESEDPKRGLGLKILKDFALDYDTGVLYIITGTASARVTAEHGTEYYDALPDFPGTLVCFELGDTS